MCASMLVDCDKTVPSTDEVANGSKGHYGSLAESLSRAWSGAKQLLGLGFWV